MPIHLRSHSWDCLNKFPFLDFVRNHLTFLGKYFPQGFHPAFFPLDLKVPIGLSRDLKSIMGDFLLSPVLVFQDNGDSKISRPVEGMVADGLDAASVVKGILHAFFDGLLQKAQGI